MPFDPSSFPFGGPSPIVVKPCYMAEYLENSCERCPGHRRCTVYRDQQAMLKAFEEIK